MRGEVDERAFLGHAPRDSRPLSFFSLSCMSYLSRPSRVWAVLLVCVQVRGRRDCVDDYGEEERGASIGLSWCEGEGGRGRGGDAKPTSDSTRRRSSGLDIARVDIARVGLAGGGRGEAWRGGWLRAH
jgi:hypothetical protein